MKIRKQICCTKKQNKKKKKQINRKESPKVLKIWFEIIIFSWQVVCSEKRDGLGNGYLDGLNRGNNQRRVV